jgi:site-specific DNA-methyltransferase (adenine-specific)
VVKPYYQDEWATIYQGDCREVLSVVPSPRVVITDPPYGINYQTANLGKVTRDNEVPIDWLAYISLHTDKVTRLYWFTHERSIGKVQEALVQLGWSLYRMLVWDKISMTPGDLSDYGCRTEYIISAVAAGQRDRLRGARDSNLISVPRVDMRVLKHPTEKPLALMSYLVVRSTGPSELVLDPFMGSGTTLVAAKQLQRHAIGIEIEERYCEIAARRCEMMQESLFTKPVEKPEPQAVFFDTPSLLEQKETG